MSNDDANIIFRENKWWLYYKGKAKLEHSKNTKIGVATSDNLTGPYKKHPANPLFEGHALTTWVHKDGIAAFSGTGKLLWSQDGINFTIVKNFKNASTGIYCPQNFIDGINDEGITWGLEESEFPRHIFRFSTNMKIKD